MIWLWVVAALLVGITIGWRFGGARDRREHAVFVAQQEEFVADVLVLVRRIEEANVAGDAIWVDWSAVARDGFAHMQDGPAKSPLDMPPVQ